MSEQPEQFNDADMDDIDLADYAFEYDAPRPESFDDSN